MRRSVTVVDDPELAAEFGSVELPVRRWPERRLVVLSAAALLLIGAFAASTLSESALDELAVLYVLPVMLVGLELGVRLGAGAAAIALVLLLAASGRQSELEPLGLAASGAVFVIVGVLAGRFSERMRAARRRQERLLTSGLRLARLENLDALPRVLAEELKGALDVSSVDVQLRGADEVAVGSAPGETLRVPISGHGIGFGSLTVGLAAGRSFTPEDRVVAGRLALQAGVAAENQRLLASERERVALHAELQHTRRRLANQLRNVNQILDSEEAGRREIARQLHEQTAQAMAGVLLGLRVLERDLDEDLTRKQLEEIRGIARDTLDDLRALAVTLRPPSLDDLGLASALVGMAERETERRGRQVMIHVEGSPRNLPAITETCAYHFAEDAIHALSGPLTVRLDVDQARNRLLIRVSGRSVHQPEQLLGELGTARARLELLGGSLRTRSGKTGTVAVVAELPLPPASDDRAAVTVSLTPARARAMPCD